MSLVVRDGAHQIFGAKRAERHIAGRMAVSYPGQSSTGHPHPEGARCGYRLFPGATSSKAERFILSL